MPSRRPRASAKKYFTIEQANKMLPLVRVIVRDISVMAMDLQRRQEELVRRQAPKTKEASDRFEEEGMILQLDMAHDAARVEELVDELRELGVELKGWDGLVDFPCLMDGREVYLCWKLGEAEITHWHELDGGFAGRQKLLVEAGVEADEPITTQRSF
jgi:hypothetical protein